MVSHLQITVKAQPAVKAKHSATAMHNANSLHTKKLQRATELLDGFREIVKQRNGNTVGTRELLKGRLGFLHLRLCYLIFFHDEILWLP